MPSIKKIKKRDMMGIMGIVNDNKTKDEQFIFFILSTNGQWLDGCVQKVRFEIFRERESTFSLDFRPIEPSVFDEARSKAVLRG